MKKLLFILAMCLSVFASAQCPVGNLTQNAKWRFVFTQCMEDTLVLKYADTSKIAYIDGNGNLTTITYAALLDSLNVPTSDTTYPPASVLFTDSNGNEATDSANFVWDDVNKRLVVSPSISVPVIGTEEITLAADRDFSSSTGNWTGTNWTIGAGVASHTAGANAFTLTNAALTAPPTTSTYYLVTFTVTTTTTGTLTASFGGGSGTAVGTTLYPSPDINVTTGSNVFSQIIFTSYTDSLIFTPSAAWEGTIDNISIKEVTISQPPVVLKNLNGTTGVELRAGGGGSNLFFGNNSGFSATGTLNTGVGTNSLRSNTTGVRNVAFGSSALFFNTSGGNNSAFGTNALLNNITGGGNCAFGRDALIANLYGINNVAIGLDAMEANIDGAQNVGIGVSALNSNTIGYRNLALGYFAGELTTTGYRNIFIGERAGRSNTTGYHNIVIGSQVDAPSATDSFQMTIGNLIFARGGLGTTTTIGTGKVGIKDNNPQFDLSIAGSFSVTQTARNYDLLDSLTTKDDSTGEIRAWKPIRLLALKGDTNTFGELITGKITASGNLITSANLQLGGSNLFIFASRSLITSPSDGVLRFTNNGQTDFNRLQFGGTTSSFPSLKRSGTGIQIRLADDSDFAPFEAGATNINTVLTLNPISATTASALTPTLGMMVVVNTTNGTFTSTGLWFYNGATWVFIA